MSAATAVAVAAAPAVAAATDTDYGHFVVAARRERLSVTRCGALLFRADDRGDRSRLAAALCRSGDADRGVSHALGREALQRRPPRAAPPRRRGWRSLAGVAYRRVREHRLVRASERGVEP